MQTETLSAVDLLDADQEISGLAKEAETLLASTHHWQEISDCLNRYGDAIRRVCGDEILLGNANLGRHETLMGQLRQKIDKKK